jgi:diguanylate cyclase (GGDEF)-like protein
LDTISFPVTSFTDYRRRNAAYGATHQTLAAGRAGGTAATCYAAGPSRLRTAASRTFSNVVDGRYGRHAMSSMRDMLEAVQLSASPNPLVFQQRLGQAVREAARDTRSFAVLVLAIDGSEDVGEQYGHRTAERLLQSVGTRLQAAVRDTDLVARIGEEEFGVLLHDVSAVDAGKVSCRLGEALTQLFVVNGHRVRVSVRTGLSLYPGQGCDAQTLLRQAAAEVGIVL